MAIPTYRGADGWTQDGWRNVSVVADTGVFSSGCPCGRGEEALTTTKGNFRTVFSFGPTRLDVAGRSARRVVV